MNGTDRPQTTARRGFFPAVIGQDVHVEEAGGVAFIARRDLHVTRGGGQWLVAAGSQTISQGGGAVMLSRQARVTDGFVVLLVAGRATLEGRARALLSVSPPTAVALAAGVALGWLWGRLRE